VRRARSENRVPDGFERDDSQQNPAWQRPCNRSRTFPVV
jgi:hypothetical protein